MIVPDGSGGVRKTPLAHPCEYLRLSACDNASGISCKVQTRALLSVEKVMRGV